MAKTGKSAKKFLEPVQYFLRHQRSLAQSFNWAIEGLSFSLRTQRNMKIHFVTAGIVLLLSMFMQLSKLELIAILFAISFVIVAELFNTAIEVAVDLATNGEQTELAKIAKDVAAAGVLIAAFNSVFIGFLVFFRRFTPLTLSVINRISQAPEYVSGIAVIFVFGITIVLKLIIGEGTPARGGWPSIHSAFAGSLFASITIISKNFLVGTLALFLSLLVMQARVEKEIHTVFEVVSGFLIGVFITILFFQIFYF